jgi:Mn-dependent DtxR family transcriptional regulator
MILLRLHDYLRRHGRASLADLAQGLDSTPEAVEAMLAILERKGKVRRLPPGSTCGTGCCRCDPTALTLYEAAE